MLDYLQGGFGVTQITGDNLHMHIYSGKVYPLNILRNTAIS